MIGTFWRRSTAVLPAPLATVLLGTERPLPSGAEPPSSGPAPPTPLPPRAPDQVTVSESAPLLALWQLAEAGLQSLAQALPKLEHALEAARPEAQPTQLGQLARSVGAAAQSLATTPDLPRIAPVRAGPETPAPGSAQSAKVAVQVAQTTAATPPAPPTTRPETLGTTTLPVAPRSDAAPAPETGSVTIMPLPAVPQRPILTIPPNPTASPATLYASVALLPVNLTRDHPVERWRDSAGTLLLTADTLLDRAEHLLRPVTVAPSTSTPVPDPAALWAMAQLVQARRDVTTALDHIGRSRPGRVRAGITPRGLAFPTAQLRSPVAFFGALLISLVLLAMLWLALGVWVAITGLAALVWTWRVVVSARAIRIPPP